MSTYIAEGVGADPVVTLFSNPTQELLNKVKAAIKTDVMEGPTHLNAVLRLAIKTAVWKSLKFKDMDKVAAALDLSKPFLVIPAKIIKGYQKLRFLAADGIVGDITAAQLVKDAQAVLAKVAAAPVMVPGRPTLPGTPPATQLDAYKEFQRMLLMPPFKPFKSTPGTVTPNAPTGYTQRPPEPTGTQNSYRPTDGGAMPDNYRYQQGGGGHGTRGNRYAMRQTQPISVRTAFSVSGLVTTIIGSIAAIYAVRAIQVHGPKIAKVWKAAKAQSRRVW